MCIGGAADPRVAAHVEEEPDCDLMYRRRTGGKHMTIQGGGGSVLFDGCRLVNTVAIPARPLRTFRP